VSAKYSFQLQSRDRRRPFPHKLIVGQNDDEGPAQVLLRLLAYLLFFRERLQLEVSLHDDAIPFVPDLVQLDYELRPVLWVECGDCSVAKLDRLAVKVPEAAIWVIRRSLAEAEQLQTAMRKADLRRDRYHLVGLDATMFDEILALMQPRNRVFWVGGAFDPPGLEFDFNGLWFEGPFSVLRF
jgi:uncharacterized protein YaeQ